MLDDQTRFYTSSNRPQAVVIQVLAAWRNCHWRHCIRRSMSHLGAQGRNTVGHGKSGSIQIRIVPKVGRIAVVRMDPVDMVSRLNLDDIALAQAQALHTKKYLIYLDDVSTQYRWRLAPSFTSFSFSLRICPIRIVTGAVIGSVPLLRHSGPSRSKTDWRRPWFILSILIPSTQTRSRCARRRSCLFPTATSGSEVPCHCVSA